MRFLHFFLFQRPLFGILASFLGIGVCVLDFDSGAVASLGFQVCGFPVSSISARVPRLPVGLLGFPVCGLPVSLISARVQWVPVAFLGFPVCGFPVSSISARVPLLPVAFLGYPLRSVPVSSISARVPWLPAASRKFCSALRALPFCSFSKGMQS